MYLYAKMQYITACLFINQFVSLSSHAINYCGSKMCGFTNAHTYCQFPPGPGPLCAGYTPAPLEDHDKSRLLQRLNRRRNDAAGGRLRGLPTAGNMLKLRWVAELAREAQLWADQCRPPNTLEEHDTCRDLYSITVGQCVASVVGEAPGLRVESMVDMWYMQGLRYKGNITLYEPPESSRHYYGDFGQMMWARTFMVGCGRSRFMVPLQGRLRSVDRLVCNFAPRGPSPYRALWSPAAPAAACPSRSQPDAVHTSLCTYQYELDASHDVDNSMTIEEHVILSAVLEMERNDSYGSLDELYLTNLAIVTMQNDLITTSYYSSLQKRDIIEKTNEKADENKDSRLSELTQFVHTSINHNAHQEITTKLPTKKLKLIGRPKTYNFEELTEVRGKEERESRKTTEDNIEKRKRELYDDYIAEIQEDDEITTNNGFNAENTFNQEKDTHIEGSTEINTTVVSVKLTRIDAVNNKISTEAYLNNTVVAVHDYQAVNETKVEDYLNDPEMLRALQEALTRMESRGESANNLTAEKVFRQGLQEPSPDFDKVTPIELNAIPYPEVPSKLVSDDTHNKTSERAPMLNMVLKYMPYLKQYEKELLGKQNSANDVDPSVMMIAICLLL